MASQTSPTAQVITAVLILVVSVSLYLWPSEQSENTISKDLSQVSGNKLPLLKEQIDQSFSEEQTETEGGKTTKEKNTQEQTKEELTQENIISDTSQETIPADKIEPSATETEIEEENEEIKFEEIKGLSTLTALFSLTRAVITSNACGGEGLAILGIPGRLSIANCCEVCCRRRHGSCRDYGCQGQCGVGVAYLWDSTTKICGCGT